MKRKQEVLRWGDGGDGVELTFTRKGVKLSAWFNTHTAIVAGVLIPWADLDALRQRVNAVQHREHPEEVTP